MIFPLGGAVWWHVEMVRMKTFFLIVIKFYQVVDDDIKSRKTEIKTKIQAKKKIIKIKTQKLKW